MNSSAPLILITLLLPFIAYPAIADSPCLEGSTPERADCIGKIGAKLEVALDQALKKAKLRGKTRKKDLELPEVVPDLEKAVAQSQKSWHKYREDQCHVIEGEYWGGTAATYVWLECMNDLTQKRIIELDQIYNDNLPGTETVKDSSGKQSKQKKYVVVPLDEPSKHP